MAKIPSYWIEARLTGLKDIEEFERIPVAERGFPTSTYEMLRDGCLINPAAPALYYFDNGDSHRTEHLCISHGELLAGVNRMANLLHALGIRKDDVVTTLLPNIPETQFALWGSQAAGIVNPINWMLEPDIIVKLMKAARAKVLIAFGEHDEIDIWPKVEQVVAKLPELEAVIRMGGRPPKNPPAGIKYLDYHAVIGNYRADGLDSERKFHGDDVVALFHTGGTTGAPKLAKHTHAGETFMCWVSAVSSGLKESDIRVCGVPLFHVTGVISNSLTPLVRGASVVLMTALGWRHPSSLRNFWDIVDTFKITGAGLVPTVVNQLLNIPLNGADISSLQIVTCGTAPLSVSVAHAFQQMTGIEIIEGFGMTETTAVSASNPRYGRKKIGSIGIRYAYQKMKIVKFDAQGRYLSDCAPNEAGLLVIRGPNVFAGYLDKSHDAKTWIDGDWLNTGDLAYCDEDGYFWITGRAKDLIIRGGHNIDPRMVEECFYRHPDVAEAAVVGRPDAHAGELPVAYLSLKPTARGDVRRLKHFSYETIPERAAVPKNIYIVDALPKTAVGKIQKNRLRADSVLRAHGDALRDVLASHVFHIEVKDQGESGLLSEIRVTGVTADDRERLKAEIDEALKPFTVKYTVLFSERQMTAAAAVAAAD